MKHHRLKRIHFEENSKTECKKSLCCPMDREIKISAQQYAIKRHFIKMTSYCWVHILVKLTSINFAANQIQLAMENKATEEKLAYGWSSFRPRLLQFLNTPKWFLFFLCQYFFTQSVIANGVFPASVSTIERRFGYSRYAEKVFRIN